MNKSKEVFLIFVVGAFSAKTSKQMTERNGNKTACFGDSMRQRFACMSADAEFT
jgi:hypothetical protein